MKHAYADRAHHLGDPTLMCLRTAYVTVVLRKSEANDPNRTFETEFYGQKIAPPQDAGTQHISAQDGEGGVADNYTNTSLVLEWWCPSLGWF